VVKLGLNFVVYIGILEVMVSFSSRISCWYTY
jgi:hypothetical protein